MALQDVARTYPFTQGLDTKTESKLSLKPSRLENCFFKGGDLVKRYGTTQLASAIDTGGNFSAGEAVFSYDNELVRLNGGKAYGLSSKLNAWVTKAGTAPILTHTLKRIVRKSSSQQDMDHATSNGVTVTAWVDAGIHIAVYDEATGTFHQTGATALSGTANHVGCRCVALGTKVLVFFCAPASALKIAIIDTTIPESVPGVSTLQSDLTGALGGASFDAMATTNGYAVVAYVTGTAGSEHWQLFAVNGVGSVLGSPAKTDMGAVGVGGGTLYLLLHQDANGVGYVLNFNGSVYYSAFSTATFASIKALTLLSTGTGSESLAAVAEATAGSLTVFMSGVGASNGGNSAYFVRRAVVTSSAITTAAANIPGTAGLALQSDGFLVNGIACCLVVNDASYTNNLALQPTAWVLDVNGNPLAKILPSLCQVSGGSRLMRPFTTTAGAVALLVGEQGQTSYSSQQGAIISTTPHGVTRCDVLLTSAAQVPSVRLGDAVYVGGSLPRIYDGQQMVEAGHNIFPEGISVAVSSGSNLSAGVYQYRVVYSWINARGEFQRSAPSPGVSVTIAAGANQAATVTIPTQRLSGRDVAGLSPVYIEVYRTQANGTLFQRASSVSAPLLNNTAAATVTFVDNSVTDTGLAANEILYTTGGILDCIAPPGFKAACAHKGRLVIVGLDDPYEWRHSSKTVKGQMLRFNESWGGRIPSSAGPLTACASLDDKLILFTANTYFVVLGDGPDLAGNGAFGEPQPVTGADAGATTALSMCETPDGILFQSAKGICLLDRGLNTVYLGADVEAYGTNTVRAATLRPEVEQVWVFTDTGTDTGAGATCLVWDYHYKQWSVLTSYGAQDACYYQGKLTRVRSDGVVFQEQPGTWLDSGVAYSSVAETAWLKPGDLFAGAVRVKRAALLGAYGSDFTLTWDVAYDYSGTASPTYLAADTVTLVGNGTYTAGGEFVARRLLRVQKCRALKMRFADSAISGTGQGMGLTSLELLFGVKRGLAKLPQAKSVG